jgi:hypothetical protein
MSATLRCALALGLVAIGCGAPGARTPAATVDGYFRDLARDPIRTLPLLTTGFHEQHGLGVVTAAEAQRPAPRDAASAAGAAGPASVDRLQLGWLAVQSRDSFRALRDRLSVTPLTVTEDGASAVVVVRVQPSGAAAFDQLFALSRSAADGAWRIESVEQQRVTAESLPAAFVAHPSEATRRELAQAGGRKSR